MEMNEFDLAAVLSVSSGRLLTTWDNLCEIMMFLCKTDDTGEMTYYSELAKSHVLSQHPYLNGVGVNETFNSGEEIREFVEEQKKKIAEKLALFPVPTEVLESYNGMDNVSSRSR